ncbi:MAG: SDR family NAD(P)-dependent oxidoreductase [Candidatus Aureabacteria bacterium]|nr:SDR family NAD(P)-dependent oxidoreductase [Candidatus Auribacterota bacterium]
MKVLITGGAGFIGCNAAERYIKKKNEVLLIDNLSRKGSSKNLSYLKNLQQNLDFYQIDIRNREPVEKFFKTRGPFDLILHLAAQVAVTTSVEDPRDDFEVNAIGTFNILEAMREYSPNAFFINASTNKVYGGMTDIEVVEEGGRYQYKDLKSGIPEKRLLDFHSPYGCSKGAADQYTIDYSRIYGLKTVSLRQSCIYGYRQFGVEDQGWVAWFTIAAVLGRPITIYGDGKQVRDVLFVEDLIRCYDRAYEKRDAVNGKAYNIGGGPANQMSLLELIGYLEKLTGKKLSYSFDQWRPGDQPVFVCDIEKAKKDFGWQPKVDVKTGVETLFHWVKENKELFEDFA